MSWAPNITGGQALPTGWATHLLVPKGVQLSSAGIAPTAWCCHKCCHCSAALEAMSPLCLWFRSCLLSLPVLHGKGSGAREEEEAWCHLLIVQRLVCLTPGRDAAVSSGKGSGGSCA